MTVKCSKAGFVSTISGNFLARIFSEHCFVLSLAVEQALQCTYSSYVVGGLRVVSWALCCVCCYILCGDSNLVWAVYEPCGDCVVLWATYIV